MKKYFSLLLIAAAMAACTGNKGYTVSGTTEDIADSTYVYLSGTERNDSPSDSALVINNSFTLTGIQDTAAMRRVSVGNQKLDFVLENGNINLVIKKESQVGGTALNDTLQEYNNKVKKMGEEWSRFYAAYNDTINPMSDQDKKRLDSELLNKMYDLHHNAAKENMDNPLGIYIIRKHWQFEMRAADIYSLLSVLPAERIESNGLDWAMSTCTNIVNTSEGKSFADFKMATHKGDSLSISDIVTANKFTFIDFWASWCGPCCADLPELKKVYDEFHSKGFEIVGVSLDSKSENWTKAIDEYKLTWPQMSDLKGWKNKGAELYGVFSIPSGMLIGNDSIIISRGIRSEQLKSKLHELLD